MKDGEKNLRDDLITPPDEYVDRVLKPAQKRKKRIMVRCIYCNSTHLKQIQKPNIYICLICKKRFNRMK